MITSSVTSDPVQLLGAVPPHDLVMEEAVLGACLLAPGAVAEVADFLVPECFYSGAGATIFRALLEMFEADDPIDIFTVTVKLRKKGQLTPPITPYYISSLTNRVASGLHLQRHARILVELFMTRESSKLQARHMRRSQDPTVDPFLLVEENIRNMQELEDRFTRRGSERYAVHEAEEIAAMGTALAGTQKTGFASLDKKIGGWTRGDLVVVAGRPGMGKTSTMLSLANVAADLGHPTLLLQMELTRMANQARLVACRKGIPLAAMIHHDLSEAQKAMRKAGMVEAEKLPLYIRYATALRLNEIRAEIIRQKREHGITTVFIDQLNWIQTDQRMNRDQEVGMITRGLKHMALQLDLCIVFAHQLSRAVEGRGGDKRPKLSDLRDSGNVEQDVQIAMFCYRPEYYGITEDDHGSTVGAMDLVVAKNSNGELGDVRLRFNGTTASVSEADPAANQSQMHYQDDNPF